MYGLWRLFFTSTGGLSKTKAWKLQKWCLKSFANSLSLVFAWFFIFFICIFLKETLNMWKDNSGSGQRSLCVCVCARAHVALQRREPGVCGADYSCASGAAMLRTLCSNPGTHMCSIIYFLFNTFFKLNLKLYFIYHVRKTTLHIKFIQMRI